MLIIPCQVYILFLLVILLAAIIVFAKIWIYDWWLKGGEVSGYQFIPLDQAKYSNKMYTGNGFIPEDYIQFHTWLAEREQKEQEELDLVS